MRIFIISLIGESIEIECTEKTTINEILQKLYEKTDIPVEQQQLIYLGNRLYEVENSLEHYGIKDETTLHMVLKIKGGRKHCIIV